MGKNSKNPMEADMAYVLQEAHRDIKMAINCHQIGTIQSFDAETQLATVKLSMKQVAAIDDDGTKTIREYPLLAECPVIVLFGGIDFLSMPIEPGDNCLVYFNDRQIDEWLNFGDGSTPSVSRVHDLSDGIAIVGINPLKKSIGNYLAEGMRLSHGEFGSEDHAKLDLIDGVIDTIAELFFHHGSMRISGDLTIDGDTYGNGSQNFNLKANLIQEAGYEIHDGRGVSGTFDVVTVIDGIVVSGGS